MIMNYLNFFDKYSYAMLKMNFKFQSPDYYYNKRNAKVEDEIRKKKVFNKKNRGPLLMPVEEGIKLVKAGGK